MDWHATTWQTVGPYFSIGLAHLRVDRLASLDEAGEHVAVEGQVLDYLPPEMLDRVRNLDTFAGILALDKWTCNADGR